MTTYSAGLSCSHGGDPIRSPHLKAAASFVFVLIVLLSILSRGCALDPPRYDPRHKLVTDLTGTLTPAQTQQLQNKLQQIEKSDSTQIAILMIPSLHGDDLLQYSQNVFQTWGIGQKEKNNGILLLVVKKEHRARIHVGYGLEGRLPDALAYQVLTAEVIPEFRQNRYYEGLDRGVNAIVQAVRGEYKAQAASQKQNSRIATVLLIAWLLVFFAGFVWVLIRVSRSRVRSDGSGAGAFPDSSLPGAGPFPMGGMGSGPAERNDDDHGPENFGGGESGGGGAESNW